MVSCVSWQCFRFVLQLLNSEGCFAESSHKLFLPLKVKKRNFHLNSPGLALRIQKALETG